MIELHWHSWFCRHKADAATQGSVLRSFQHIAQSLLLQSWCWNSYFFFLWTVVCCCIELHTLTSSVTWMSWHFCRLNRLYLCLHLVVIKWKSRHKATQSGSTELPRAVSRAEASCAKTFTFSLFTDFYSSQTCLEAEICTEGGKGWLAGCHSVWYVRTGQPFCMSLVVPGCLVRRYFLHPIWQCCFIAGNLICVSVRNVIQQKQGSCLPGPQASLLEFS